MSAAEFYLVVFQIRLGEVVMCDDVCAINSALNEQSIGGSVLYV